MSAAVNQRLLAYMLCAALGKTLDTAFLDLLFSKYRFVIAAKRSNLAKNLTAAITTPAQDHSAL
jgi:hypothetical protein